jgi:hypothetical protein
VGVQCVESVYTSLGIQAGRAFVLQAVTIGVLAKYQKAEALQYQLLPVVPFLQL